MQVCIQSVGFSLPLTLVTPCTLVTVISMCGARAYDKVGQVTSQGDTNTPLQCSFETSSFYIPNRLFFECHSSSSLADLGWDTWLALAWFLSYLWVTRHIWSPRRSVDTSRYLWILLSTSQPAARLHRADLRHPVL